MKTKNFLRFTAVITFAFNLTYCANKDNSLKMQNNDKIRTNNNDDDKTNKKYINNDDKKINKKTDDNNDTLKDLLKKLDDKEKKFLKQICSNIINNPKKQKYRSLNINTLKKKYGDNCLKILSKLGFQNNENIRLEFNTKDTNSLKECLSFIDSQTNNDINQDDEKENDDDTKKEINFKNLKSLPEEKKFKNFFPKSKYGDPKTTVSYSNNKVIKKFSSNVPKQTIMNTLLFIGKDLFDIYVDKENNIYIEMPRYQSITQEDITKVFFDKALEALKEVGSKHGDIHPDNIMKNNKNEIRFIDPDANIQKRNIKNGFYYNPLSQSYNYNDEDKALARSFFFIKNNLTLMEYFHVYQHDKLLNKFQETCNKNIMDFFKIFPIMDDTDNYLFEKMTGFTVHMFKMMMMMMNSSQNK